MDSGGLGSSRVPPFMVKVPPVISVVIAVYNDWHRIGGCLKSLSEQTNAPPFEVVVVDDGSLIGAPNQVVDWSSSYPIKFIRQSHAGLAVARNRGLQVAAGAIFVFVDCDCVLRPDCLTLLMSVVALSPQDACFQLRLVGDCSYLVGRAEHLHLSTVQQRFLLDDGLHIRFIGAGGIAVRSEVVHKSRGLFDARAIRAQDTLLLSELIHAGHMPRFVPDAVVLHAVNLTLREYLLKALKTGYLEGKTYGMIASRGMTIRITTFQRVSMLASLWINSRQSSAGLFAFFIVGLRQILKLVGSAAYRCFHLRPDAKGFCGGLDDASLRTEHDNQ
jgi:glycosyltransferase involved in cell wall biosynthesis